MATLIQVVCPCRRLEVAEAERLKSVDEFKNRFFTMHEEQALIAQAIDRCLLAWAKLGGGDYEAAQRLLHPKVTSA